MPELALGVADGEEASAIELLLEFHDDVRAGGFHSLVMRLDIADDNKGSSAPRSERILEQFANPVWATWFSYGLVLP